MSIDDDWKKKHANDSEAAAFHPIVDRVIDEQIYNLRSPMPDSLVRYGLRKIACYAAQIARAQALGFDPELLRLTPDEQNELSMNMARMAVELGKPVIMFDPSTGDSTTVTRLAEE